MKLTDWMDVNGICVGVTLKDKEGVIDILAALQQKCGNTERSSKKLLREIYYQEEQASFAIGAGVAVCYIKSDAVKRPLLTAVTVPAGIDLNAPDGEKSRLIFLAAVPMEETLDPTPRLTVLLMNENLREQLMEAADESTFVQLISLAEEGDYPAPPGVGGETMLLLAVVDESFPSATEAAAQLQLTAGRLGMLLKMEREGGISFSDEDIQDASAILLIGKNLHSDRFDGKPVLEVNISDGIYRPEHLLKMAIKAPIYHKRIVFKRKKKNVADWYYRSNAPLLPLLLFAGGVFLLAGKALDFFFDIPSFTNGMRWIGERTLLLLLPRVCGMLGFRYARWPGLAVGLIGGAILEVACGGVWAALIGGVVTALTVHWAERGLNLLPRRFRWLEWGVPVIGVGTVAGLAFILNRVGFWAQKGFFLLSSNMNLRLKGILYGVSIGLDPGGPLNRAVLETDQPELLAAISAGGLALSIGLTAFCILKRSKIDSIHFANGWTALPAGLCGAIKSYIVFFAGDPFRIAPCAALGSGAAGLLAVSLKCHTDSLGIFGAFSCNRPGAFLLAVVCGAVLCCTMLCVVYSNEKCSHDAKK